MARLLCRRARESRFFAGHSETGRQRCGSDQRSVCISRSTCVNTDAKSMQQQNDFLLATCKTLGMPSVFEFR